MLTDIPLLPDTPSQVLEVNLAGRDYKIFLWWQPGDGEWYTSIESPPRTPLTTGRRISVNAPLIETFHDLGGNIYCLPISGATALPTLTAWGQTHRLAFIADA